MATATTPLLPSPKPKPRSNWRRHVAIVILLLAVGGLAAGLVIHHVSEPDNPQKTDPIVHLCGNAGEVSGSWEGDVAVFRGIPYGTAPRWQVPSMTISCWTSTFDAKTDGYVCPQFALSSYVVDPPTKQDEDCLHVNVMSTNVNNNGNDKNEDNDSLLPIVFFIHGGSNVVGWPSWYANMDVFARNNFCVIAPSYRLGTLGFLALPQLTVCLFVCF